MFYFEDFQVAKPKHFQYPGYFEGYSLPPILFVFIF